MKRWLMGILTFLFIFSLVESVKATQVEDMMGEMDFSDITAFLEKTEISVDFEEVIRALINGEEIPYEKLGDYVKNFILSGFRENKALIGRLLVIALAFSILKNYGKSFSNSYISEISFFLCYCFMMILLLQSFALMNDTVMEATETMVDFMKVLIPTYCMAISFSLNLNSSAAVYSMIFFAIYLVEWLMRYMLIPLVQVYIMIEFLNHLMEEERFRRLSELVASVVKNLLKVSVSFILGMNIIQGMLAPALDRLAGNTVAKTVQMIPGMGNVMSGMGQIVISSGLVIKNCVGAAALVILVLLCGVPFLKMAFLAVVYKFLSAILEPIADKRLSGGMNGIANGGILYLKILSTCMMLFFLTIALSSIATGLGGGG